MSSTEQPPSTSSFESQTAHIQLNNNSIISNTITTSTTNPINNQISNETLEQFPTDNCHENNSAPQSITKAISVSKASSSKNIWNQPNSISSSTYFTSLGSGSSSSGRCSSSIGQSATLSHPFMRIYPQLDDDLINNDSDQSHFQIANQPHNNTQQINPFLATYLSELPQQTDNAPFDTALLQADAAAATSQSENSNSNSFQTFDENINFTSLRRDRHVNSANPINNNTSAPFYNNNNNRIQPFQTEQQQQQQQTQMFSALNERRAFADITAQSRGVGLTVAQDSSSRESSMHAVVPDYPYFSNFSFLNEDSEQFDADREAEDFLGDSYLLYAAAASHFNAPRPSPSPSPSPFIAWGIKAKQHQDLRQDQQENSLQKTPKQQICPNSKGSSNFSFKHLESIQSQSVEAITLTTAGATAPQTGGCASISLTHESVKSDSFWEQEEEVDDEEEEEQAEENNENKLSRRRDDDREMIPIEEELADFVDQDMFTVTKQDQLLMQARETEYEVDVNILLNYQSTFTNFPKKRAILLDWMQEFSSSLGFKRETYQQSISITDRYFARVPLIPKGSLQLVGATALLIAHKIEEVVFWKIQDFIMACNYGYTNQQFLDMEITICNTLKFSLSSTPGYFWMNLMMLEWDSLIAPFEAYFETDAIYFKRNTEHSFQLFVAVCQYFDCVQYDINSYAFPARTLLACFMYWTLYSTFELRRTIEPTKVAIKLNYLEQIFERFVADVLGIMSLEEVLEPRKFTYPFLQLNLNLKVPVVPKRTLPEELQHQQEQQPIQESFENICSQQTYNSDSKRIFGL